MKTNNKDLMQIFNELYQVSVISKNYNIKFKEHLKKYTMLELFGKLNNNTQLAECHKLQEQTLEEMNIKYNHLTEENIITKEIWNEFLTKLQTKICTYLNSQGYELKIYT